ncbi:MAG: biopolymer transporter ExbD [Cyanobacteria bacterium]|nr:biopolymer transporter ExbD [Cyanobacteriota bacterium]
MHSSGKHKQVFNEINITPLTDIFLVLLIIMMVVAPLMQQQNQSIKPPKIQGGMAMEQGKLIVEVTTEGGIYIDGKAVNESELVSILKEKAGKMEEKNVVVRADGKTKSSAVLKVFNAARDAEYQKVTVAGEPLSDERESELKSEEPTS